ncbi:MAG: M23 family metallopeptidase [Patescibacteria group bacterium]
MKYRFYHFLVRGILAIGDWAMYIGGGAHTLFLFFGAGIGKATKGALPAALFFYKTFRDARLLIGRVLRPAEQRIFFILAHRYLAHVLVVGLAVFAMATASRASEDADTGEKSLLFDILQEEDAVVIEGGLPSWKVLASEDFFVDFPPEELDSELPLALDGHVFLPIELSPSEAVYARKATEEYIVQTGDTASGIARKFSISINTVLWTNGLSPYSVIRAGQKLLILPVTGVAHEIKKGDTIERIAKTYGVLPGEVLSFNGIDPTVTLEVGQRLIVPGGVPYRAPTPVSRPPTAIPAPAVRPAPAPKVAGMLWPTESRRITQYFSWRHPALDIAAPKGTPIYASDDGVVIFVEQRYTGYGWQVMVDHGNGLKTRYAHASKIYVKKGQRVSKGDVLALMGSTGKSTGPHLHFEIYVSGRRVNPFTYVK